MRDERIRVRRLDDLGAPAAPGRRCRPREAGTPASASRSRRPDAQSPRCSAARSAPSFHVTRSRRRALCACHQLSATIATPGMSPRVSVVPATTNACLTPGSVLDLVEIRADDGAAVHRAFFVHGPQHAGQREVDAERRLPGHDRAVVDAALRLADGREAGGRLERHRRDVGRSHRRGRRGKLAVRQRSGCSRDGGRRQTPRSTRSRARPTSAPPPTRTSDRTDAPTRRSGS